MAGASAPPPSVRLRAPRKTSPPRAAARQPRLSVAEKYLNGVRDGSIVTSRLVRKAVERHFRDIETGAERGLKFDRKAAQRPIDFFSEFLVHTEGEWDGKPFIMTPAQQAKTWILYGWLQNRQGAYYRRFKWAYNEEGRGNGKSAYASGLCIYELVAFGEAGPWVYSAATDKKTAKLVWNTSELMVKRSAPLRSRITIFRENMHIPGTAAKFEPCAAEDDKLLGLRPHFTLIDELHEHKTSGIWDVFTSAMGKRKQPLLLAITNSGYDRNSVCWKQREYSVKVLDQIFDDDNWFAWIQGIDDDDDWEDESCWIKANPNLGSIVDIDDMRQQAQKAKNDPSALNQFLRFRLSRWTEGDVSWMPMHLWDKCRGEVEDLKHLLEKMKGRQCIGSLDLSSTGDTSSFGLVFPPSGDDPKWTVIARCFLPKDAIHERARRDRVPYDVWERQGRFILTPGRVVDYDVIRTEVRRVAEMVDLKEIVFDRWNSTDLVKDLEGDGFTMVKWGQGFQDMNAPTKRLMELVLTEELVHGGDPVLRWMASNVVVFLDAAGNVKPDKARSREKIDGIVAIIMALGRAMLVGETQYTRPYVIYA
jgi:phage terminase large subunit-like protein